MGYYYQAKKDHEALMDAIGYDVEESHLKKWALLLDKILIITTEGKAIAIMKSDIANKEQEFAVLIDKLKPNTEGLDLKQKIHPVIMKEMVDNHLIGT